MASQRRGLNVGPIPSVIIKEAHLHSGEELEIRADEKGMLTLIPIKNQQEGWLEQFNALIDDSIVMRLI